MDETGAFCSVLRALWSCGSSQNGVGSVSCILLLEKIGFSSYDSRVLRGFGELVLGAFVKIFLY